MYKFPWNVRQWAVPKLESENNPSFCQYLQGSGNSGRLSFWEFYLQVNSSPSSDPNSTKWNVQVESELPGTSQSLLSMLAYDFKKTKDVCAIVCLVTQEAVLEYQSVIWHQTSIKILKALFMRGLCLQVAMHSFTIT